MAKNTVPHVLIFPFPSQGHINSMLKLAELLAISGVHVTFLNTDFYQDRLDRYTDARARFAQFPQFRFETISNAPPVVHDPARNFLSDLVHSVKTILEPGFKNLLSQLESAERPPVTCVVADGLFSFTIQVAKEFDIPTISFRTCSACYFWACFCIPKAIQAGEIPYGDGLFSFTIEVAKQLGIPTISFRTASASYFWTLFNIPKVIQAGEIPFGEDADLDELVTSVPGMEGFVRRRDLPSFYRAKDLNDLGLNLVLTETQNSTKASAHILNTFEDLEGPILSQIRPHFPKIYTIGPLHALLDSLREEFESTPSSSSSNNSLLEVDRSCITWLDSQPSNSVIYVSFGSVGFITRKQMLEFWHGLVNSEVRFLWVIRPDSVRDKDEELETPEELSEGTKARGYMVGWSPQEEVLQHPAVGGFLTHSGWNSTLESIVTGVPMICWPQFADQQTNSRFVSEAWKIGLDMKDQCDRSLVERLVRDMMEDKREEIVRSSNKMKELAHKSVSKGGSSYSNLDELIQDIKSMKIGV